MVAVETGLCVGHATRVRAALHGIRNQKIEVVVMVTRASQRMAVGELEKTNENNFKKLPFDFLYIFEVLFRKLCLKKPDFYSIEFH
jgi:hypothetical protein